MISVHSPRFVHIIHHIIEGLVNKLEDIFFNEKDNNCAILQVSEIAHTQKMKVFYSINFFLNILQSSVNEFIYSRKNNRKFLIIIIFFP